MSGQPNVIVCLTDMLRSFAIGCYGNDHVQTPNLDRLAAEGVRFDIGISNNPVCMPARSCLLSGQYSRTCMESIEKPMISLWPDQERACLQDPMLSECFHEVGYDTALIGKWHVYPQPNLCGFDYALYPQIVHQHYDQKYVENGGDSFTVSEYAPDFEVKQIDKYISEHKENPFFLYYNISQPHMPVGPGNCPQRYLDIYDRETVPLRPNVFQNGEIAHDDFWFLIYTNPDYWYRTGILNEEKRPTDVVPEGYDLRDLTAHYYALVTSVDDQVGALMQSLERHGVAENTIVIFTSDHGDNLGSHGRFNKQLLIEESIRIPFMVWSPGRLSPAVINEQIAQLVDVMPTALDLCGLDVPDSVQGRSLVPVLRQECDLIPGDNLAYVETDHSRLIGVRSPTHKYGLKLGDNMQRMTDEEIQFYDLRSDPYEMTNLAGTGEQADRANELRAKLTAWHESTPQLFWERGVS